MSNNHKPSDIVGEIAGIEVEAVVGGCLQRIKFSGGVNPAEIKAMLLTLDPGAQVRDGLPMKGGFGKRDSKWASCVGIQASERKGSKYISMICADKEGEEITVAVGSKKADEWLPALEKLGKVSEKNLEKVRGALGGGKAATVLLADEAERFGVAYWTTDDGGVFWEGQFQAEPPAQPEAA